MSVINNNIQAIAAARAGKPEGEQLLFELLAHKGTPAIIRATAIDLLANYPTEASEKARREALNDSDPLVRLSAVRAISGELDPALIAALAERLSDSDRVIRIAAAARLVHVPIEMLPNHSRRPFEKAMIEFRESQEFATDHAGGHLTLAMLDRRANRLQESVGHLQSAIELEPYLAGPRGELASLLQEGRGNPQAQGRPRLTWRRLQVLRIWPLPPALRSRARPARPLASSSQ